jgi:hypothetical protein
MMKPVILTADAPQVSRVIERDLRRQVSEYRVLRVDPADTAPDAPGKPKLRGDRVAANNLVDRRMPRVTGRGTRRGAVYRGAPERRGLGGIGTKR